MTARLSLLQSPSAVQAALDEFLHVGRDAFLEKYGFKQARSYFVVDPRTGERCDSKAIVGAAYGYQFPSQGPLRPGDFSGGDATVAAKLGALGFEVVRIRDWSPDEVDATVAAYFEMLLMEARRESFNKAQRNAELRERLNARTKGAVELKHQNISAALADLGLPYIDGYKPMGNAQTLLRRNVETYVLSHPDLMQRVLDGYEDAQAPGERAFNATVVEAPDLVKVAVSPNARTPRFPRRLDWAALDERNHRLGRAGEAWTMEFERRRLQEAHLQREALKIEWTSQLVGDGTGFDILSYSTAEERRFIEVKTTNGPIASPFVISRNELEFSKEADDAFFLYRLFQFRDEPRLFQLRGEVSKHVHLEAIDYRASFRALRG